MKRVVLVPGSEGEVEIIGGIEIVLPKPPKTNREVLYNEKTKKKQQWIREIMPKGLDRETAPSHIEYIEEEYRRRFEGLWLFNNGEKVWIPGSHYMYIQWSKIDIGYPEFRMVNRKFFIFWEACKVDPSCFGICYLKNRRSGFSYMASSDIVNEASTTEDSRFGILSKTGNDAKLMFTDKVVKIFRNYPFFFQPIQDGSTNPRVELAFREPAKKITKNQKYVSKSEALDSSIDWKNTGNNSYDGEKLKVLVHDESAKWMKPNDIKKNWGVTRTCLMVGRRIVGKCMMGSTANKLSEGGQGYKDIYYGSDADKLDMNGRTKEGLWKLFIPAFENLEGFIDEFGHPVVETPKKPVMGIDGLLIDIGAKEYLNNIREGLKNDTSALSEHKRQFPWTEEEAFRNEAKNAIFDVERIYQQTDYNSAFDNLTVNGDFVWKGGIQDTEVQWIPRKKGKFTSAWLPKIEDRNKITKKRGKKFPGNDIKMVGGCDPYDHDTTTDGRRSNGSMHILHKFTMDGGPSMMFVLEYINRPPKADIFYEDMLKACIFYGCQLLVENNKLGIIKYFERRGYYEYLMDRPETTHTNSSRSQKTKGIPSSGEAVINAQAEAIDSYIYDNVGIHPETGEVGRCYFDKLLADWSEFDISNRTKFDATVSSGIALLGAQKVVKLKKEIKESPIFVKRYDNSGNTSRKLRL
tara:strand:+ start:3282 stop:5351 length:2070 start_codon:yes stop_codon:yes gene_type:complete